MFELVLSEINIGETSNFWRGMILKSLEGYGTIELF
jgi:hypothetical protein